INLFPAATVISNSTNSSNSFTQRFHFVYCGPVSHDLLHLWAHHGCAKRYVHARHSRHVAHAFHAAHIAAHRRLLADHLLMDFALAPEIAGGEYRAAE